MKSVLIVDDDEQLCTTIALPLSFKHTLDIAHDGATALALLSAKSFDAIILDWQLPDISGTEIIEFLRKKGDLIPILMLTAKDSLSDKVCGLNTGADDYLVKPFEIRELEARLRALLRNASMRFKLDSDWLSFEELKLSRSEHCVSYAGTSITLSPNEYSFLELLLTHPQQVVTIEMLQTRIGGGEQSIFAIRNCVKRLRAKLGPEAGKMIQMVSKLGYKLERPPLINAGG